MADLKPHSVTIDRLQKEGSLTWLHLSDIHFGGPEPDGRPAVLNRLLKDVEERKTKDGLAPDLIFLTGDIAWSGKAEQYKEEAFPFLEELQKTTGVERNRIFLIPGNHDIDRKLVASRSLVKLQEDLLTEGAKENEKEISAFLYGEDDAEDRERILKKHLAYIEFVKEHFSHCAPLFDPCAYVAKVTIPDDLPFSKLWVLGLNSAWLSREGEAKDKLLLGYPQVLKALKIVETEDTTQKDLVIALTHHPLSWMADWDERLCRQQLSQRTDFHLSGHLHEHAFSLDAVGSKRYSVISAGSAYGDGGMQWYNGYYFARLDFNLRKGTAYIRQYNPNALAFRSDTTFNSPKEGEFEWPLPKHWFPDDNGKGNDSDPSNPPNQPKHKINIPSNRKDLILFLAGLTEVQFNLLVELLEVGKAFLPGSNAEMATRATALLSLCESPTGPGLDSVRKTLDQIFNP